MKIPITISNQRIYPLELFEKEVEKLKEMIKVRNRDRNIDYLMGNTSFYSVSTDSEIGDIYIDNNGD